MSDQEEENEIVIAAGAIDRGGLGTAGGSTATGLSSIDTVPIGPRADGDLQDGNLVPGEIEFSENRKSVKEQLREAQQALEEELELQQLQETRKQLALVQSRRSKSRKVFASSQSFPPCIDDQDSSSGEDSEGTQLTQRTDAKTAVDGVTPKDRKRFQLNTTELQTLKGIFERLKKIKLTGDHWLHWSETLREVTEILNIHEYVLEGKSSPVTPQILVKEFCGGDQVFYAENIVPRLSFDLFNICVTVRDLEGLEGTEVMAEAEYLRYKSNMALLSSTIMDCLTDQDLRNVADRKSAKRTKNVVQMYENIK